MFLEINLKVKIIVLGSSVSQHELSWEAEVVSVIFISGSIIITFIKFMIKHEFYEMLLLFGKRFLWSTV